MNYFEHRLPYDATLIGKFCKLIGEQGVEEMLSQAIAHPTDSRLLGVAHSDHGVALPVAHLTASLNRGWTLGNGPSTNDLPATVSPTGVTFALLFLTTKVFPKRPTLSLVSIDMLVNRFVANRQTGGNLFWTPLKLQSLCNQRPDSFAHTTSITTRLGSRLATLIGLLGSVTALTFAARKLSADRRHVSAQQFG